MNDSRKSNGKSTADAQNTNQFQVLQSILKMGPSAEDPDGMYTGRPRDKYDVPVQDGDDL